MAVIALTSASGSPGVTTTALGLALLWPRPVLLIEADPTGGSGILAGYFGGTREYDGGLLELALAPVDVADALRDVVRPIEDSTVSYVAGTRSHAQSAGLRDLWQPLADALTGLDDQGQDVIVDAGRLGLLNSPEPLLAAAEITVLVTRSNLPALAAARSRVETVRHTRAWPNPQVFLVGAGQPYRSAEVSKVLDLPVVAEIADDPAGAAVFSRGVRSPKRFETGALVRSMRAGIAALHTEIARTRSDLVSEASQ